jgi:hypothetical protein
LDDAFSKKIVLEKFTHKNEIAALTIARFLLRFLRRNNGQAKPSNTKTAPLSVPGLQSIQIVQARYPPTNGSKKPVGGRAAGNSNTVPSSAFYSSESTKVCENSAIAAKVRTEPNKCGV